MTASGLINAMGFKEVLRKIDEITRSLSNCEILIDLRGGNDRHEPADAAAVVEEFKPALCRLDNKIALVCAGTTGQYGQLFMLSNYLSNSGFKVAVFYEVNRAIEWLTRKK